MENEKRENIIHYIALSHSDSKNHNFGEGKEAFLAGNKTKTTNGGKGQHYLTTHMNFTFKPNPIVTDIQPRNTFLR